MPEGSAAEASDKTVGPIRTQPCQTLVLKAVTVKACAADVKKVCAGTKPGRGRIQACMKGHLADVSEPCKEALARRPVGKN